MAFPMPSASSLRQASKLVFAHYMPALPISIDNQPSGSDYYARHYLAPEGATAAYGGSFRERPLPRPVSADTGTTNVGRGNQCGSNMNGPVASWRIDDMATTVRQAISAGLDGFTVDMMQMPGQTDYNNCVGVYAMLTAAHQVDPDFKIALMPDMSGSFANKSADELADYVSDLGKYPSAYHLADGRLVVAPYYPEKTHDAAWWKSWISLMETKYGTRVAFVPTFLNYSKNIDNFASISYGFSYWGTRSPAEIDATRRGYAAKAHALGKIFMEPVALQDLRPSQGNYFESNNSESLRETWKLAIENNADWVQIPTWNDYGEQSDVGPSTSIGWSALDISAYYLLAFKNKGDAPTVTKDVLYVSHRVQPYAAKPTDQTGLMTLRSYSSPARDTVEVLSFLKSEARISVTVGTRTTTYDAPAGRYDRTVPLGAGTVSAKAVRDGATAVSVTSPFTVTSTPKSQNLQYHFASSARSGGLGSYDDY
ncbi:MAG: glycoside hydrolase family 71 protein [Janthinobacterium lividum]